MVTSASHYSNNFYPYSNNSNRNTHLSEALPGDTEGETERLRVVVQDVLGAVVKLRVAGFHVVQGHLLVEKELVEGPDKEGCREWGRQIRCIR